MNRAKIPYLILVASALIAASALTMLMFKNSKREPSHDGSDVIPSPTPPTRDTSLDHHLKPNAPGDDGTGLGDQHIAQLKSTKPKDLIERIAKAINSGKPEPIDELLQAGIIDESTANQLKHLLASGMRLKQENGIREVGELDRNTKSRWALEWQGSNHESQTMFLDLVQKDQKWSLDSIKFPELKGESGKNEGVADTLGAVDLFLQAVLKQNFEFARSLVDPETVSNAKIAGLCILFEEGNYRLRPQKPLRSILQSPEAASYLVYVETPSPNQTAQFAIQLKHQPSPRPWLISEINLDQLLNDYAQRVAGGDQYYSPLVKNPSGGETLAMYFDFDDDNISPRMRRQLEIVALLLKADPTKKITISGHTDAKGNSSYNHELSKRRADVVCDHLISSGVPSSQIVRLAKGASEPRRPNVTENGADNPDGRKVNRRTEIYLDF